MRQKVRWSCLVWMLCWLGWGTAWQAWAQAPPESRPSSAKKAGATADPLQRLLIYVPYQKLGPLLKREGIYLTSAQFKRLMALVDKARRASKARMPVGYVWTQSRYEAEVSGDQTTLKVHLSLQVLRSDRLLRIPLRFAGLPLHNAQLDGKAALLSAHSNRQGYELLVEGKGEHKLTLQFAGRTNKEGGWRKLHLLVPATPQTSLQLTMPKGWHVALNDRTWKAKKSAPTLRTMTLGPRNSLRLRWRPKTQRTITQNRMMSANVRLETHLDEGVIRTRARVSVHVLQGKLQRLTLRLPPQDKLVTVDGGGLLRRWSLQQQGTQKLLVLLFQKPQQGQFSLRLQLERLISHARGPATIASIHVEEAQWQHGWIALTTARTLELKIKQTKGVTQMDPEEYAVQHKSPPPQKAFLYLTSKYQLEVETHKIKARLRAQVFHRLNIDEKQAVVHTRIQYHIERAGVFQLQFQLPKGWQLREVKCPSMQNYYKEKNDVLVVALREKLGGPVVVQQIAPERLWTQIQQLLGWDLLRQLTPALRLQLQRRLAQPAAVLALQQLFGRQQLRNAGPIECHIRMRRDLQFPKGFGLPLLQPLGLESERGLVGVAIPSHLELRTHDRKGLMRIDDLDEASAVAKGRYVLRQAFRYAVRPAAGQLALKRKKTAIHAKIWLPVQLREDGYQIQGLVRYNVRFAGVKKLQLTVPKAFSSRLQITTPTREIHKKEDKDVVHYTLILHRKVPKDGVFSLRFVVTQALKQALRVGELEQLVLPPFSVPNAIQQSLRWGLQKGEALSLQVASMKGYRRFDAADLPAWATPRKLARLLHTRSKQPKPIKVLVRKHRYARVLSTVINHRHIDAVINRDGQVQALLLMSVKNRGRQFLKLRLPQKSKVVALRVQRQERYRFELDQKGELLIDLANQTSGQNIEIALLYRHPLPDHQQVRGWWGHLRIQSPEAVDTPVSLSSLHVYLPNGPSYVSFDAKSWHPHNTQGLWEALRTMMWGRENKGITHPSSSAISSVRSGAYQLYRQLPKRGRNYYFFSQSPQLQVDVRYRSSSTQLPLEFLVGLLTLFLLLWLGQRQWSWLSTPRLALLALLGVGLLSAIMPVSWVSLTYPALFAWSGCATFWMGRGFYRFASSNAKLQRESSESDSPSMALPPTPEVETTPAPATPATESESPDKDATEQDEKEGGAQ